MKLQLHLHTPEKPRRKISKLFFDFCEDNFFNPIALIGMNIKARWKRLSLRRRLEAGTQLASCNPACSSVELAVHARVFADIKNKLEVRSGRFWSK